MSQAFPLVSYTRGRTAPLTFRLKRSRSEGMSLSGASIRFVLYSIALGQAEWSWSDDKAGVTITGAATGDISWEPPEYEDSPDEGDYYGQFEVTWADDTISYYPEDGYDQWPWTIHERASEE